jgi:hypothetical protein
VSCEAGALLQESWQEWAGERREAREGDSTAHLLKWAFPRKTGVCHGIFSEGSSCGDLNWERWQGVMSSVEMKTQT